MIACHQIRYTPSDRRLNPLNTGGPSRAAHRPQASRRYWEDMKRASSAYRCGQLGYYRIEGALWHSTRRVSYQGNGHGLRW
ncbi:hypothetical protein MRX96_041372 [Rhipicephalus microplus]